MQLNPRAVAGLSQAIKENRQLTMSERMQSDELLAVIRKDALKHFGLQEPAKPEAENSEIEKKLKKRRLYEVARYFDQPEFPGELRDLVNGLMREAMNDYQRAAWHKRAVARPEPALRAEPSHDMEARCSQIELRLAALESACVVDDEGDRASFATLNARIDALDALIAQLSDNKKEKG